MNSTVQHDVSLVWGESGLRHLSAVSVLIVVDVLSFSTSVDIACSRGATVYPWRYRDESAGLAAQRLGAYLAVPRDEVTLEQPFSLSPASMQTLSANTRIVLPSPNGATLSLLGAEKSPNVFAGCLRNANAIAKAARQAGGQIAIIAAGERWEDQSLRPSYEDLLGAGAILSQLTDLRLSPDAKAAVAAFGDAASSLEALLVECESGQELYAKGYSQDVTLAAVLNQSRATPMLRDGAFRHE